MAEWLHIVLVGTSILRNLANNLYADEPVLAEQLETVAVDPDATVQKGIDENIDKLVALTIADPRRMSAELNALHYYLETSGMKEITLIHTDTSGGRLASIILEKTLKTLYPGVAVAKKEAQLLGRVFEEGVLNLTDILAEEIIGAHRRGLRVAVNLTGGFKAETGYTLLAAALLGAEKAYYIYETTRTVTELPLPPIKIREDAQEIIEEINKNPENIHGYPWSKIDELVDRGLLDRKYKPRKWIQIYMKLLGRD